MIKAITFDLDMTLIDFMKMKKKASNAAAYAMVKAGLKMTAQEAEKELFDLYITDIEGNKVFENFLNSKGQNTTKVLAAGINAYRKVKDKHLKPYPGVKKTLSLLKKKGLKLAIITDAPKLKACMRLDAMGISDYFDFIVGKEDTGKDKRTELPFRKALELLKIKPEEVMHVGDWPERDIAGAKKVGMITCLAKYGWHMGKYVKADYEIKSIEEILKVIDNE